MKVVSAAEANRQFSQLLREVGAGETIVVTSHGRPVAKILPAGDADLAREAQARALDEFLAFARARRPQPIPAWTREELYEDEPYPETFR